MSSPFSPELAVDAQGKLTIDKNQAGLNALLSGSAQAAIDARHAVRTLVVQGVHHIPEDWPTLPNLQDLTITIHKFPKLFPRTFRASALPALQRLTLNCDLDWADSGKKVMCPVLEERFEQLRSVVVKGLAMGVDAVSSMLQPSLTSLHLSMVHCRDKGCEQVAQGLQQHACPDLRYLYLGGNSIGAQGYKHLGRAQGGCVNLAELHLIENFEVIATGYDDVVRGLEGCPSLTHLDFRLNEISQEECQRLAQALQERVFPALTYLDLMGNRIGSEGCAAVAEALRAGCCPNLTYLDLTYNDIEPAGSVRLAEALEKGACPSLSHLDLGMNEIGDEGCAALVLGLRSCPRIKYLDLQRNNIETLPEALGEVLSLSILNISDNGIEGAISPAFYDLILNLDEFCFDPSLDEDLIDYADEGMDALKNRVRELRSGAE